MDFNDELNNILEEFIGIHLDEFDGYGVTLKKKLNSMMLGDIDLELVNKIIDKRCKLEISNFKEFSHEVRNTIENMIKNQTKISVKLIYNSLEKIDKNELYNETIYTKRYLIEIKKNVDLVSLKRVICKIAYKQIYVGLKQEAYELLKERYRFFNTQLTVKSDTLRYDVEKIKLKKMNDSMLQQEQNINIDKFRGEFALKLMAQNARIDELFNKIDLLTIERKNNENQNVFSYLSNEKDEKKVQIASNILKADDEVIDEVIEIMDEVVIEDVSTTEELSKFFEESKENNNVKILKKEKSFLRKILESLIESALIIIIFYIVIYIALK